jgi:hypothetical protein
MGLRRFAVGDVRLTRVPYFDVPLDPEVAGLTAAQIQAIPWAVPTWATAGYKVLIGQAVWVVEARDRVLVIDPCGAADSFLRTGPEAIVHQQAVADALRSAGYGVEGVDTVMLSHLDGIGMTAAVDADGAWSPFFANARVGISEAELDRVRAHPELEGASALWALVDAGVVEPVGARWEPAPGVVMEVTGGHSSGHALVRIGDGAVFLGHLALSPLNLSLEPGPEAHEDLGTATAVLETELRAAASDHRLLIGPLWPEPGAVHVSGPPWVVAPAV